MKNIILIILSAIGLIISGCATGQSVIGNISPAGVSKNAKASEKLTSVESSHSSSVEYTNSIKRAAGSSKEIPLLLNNDIRRFIDYYTGEKWNDINRMMYQSMKYIPGAKEIFRTKGLPEDLAYLIITESGGNPNARSHANAVGLWQFIKGTGLRYGLKINRYRDERRDPVKSTIAAANYLKNLYSLFGDWELALAAYNCGEGRVLSAMEKELTDNFWDLKTLPRETKKYVPSFYAILRIAKYKEGYGFNFRDPEPVNFISTSQWSKNEGQTKISNSLRRRIFEAKKKTFLAGKRQDEYTVKKAQQEKVKSDKFLLVKYTPNRGESLWKISRILNVNITDIKRWNNIGSNNKILAGKPLKIYLASAEVAKAIKGKTSLYHKVRRGQTLWGIAKKYGMDIKMLLAMNSISGPNLIAGTTLKVVAD